MKTFSERLVICLAKGQMTKADLHYWMSRPYATVDSWVKGTRGGPRNQGAGAEAWRRLKILEHAIATKKGFPVPHDLSLTMRPRYIRKLFDDHSAAVPGKNPPAGRVQMRNGVR